MLTKRPWNFNTSRVDTNRPPCPKTSKRRKQKNTWAMFSRSSFPTAKCQGNLWRSWPMLNLTLHRCSLFCPVPKPVTSLGGNSLNSQAPLGKRPPLLVAFSPNLENTFVAHLLVGLRESWAIQIQNLIMCSFLQNRICSDYPIQFTPALGRVKTPSTDQRFALHRLLLFEGGLTLSRFT